MIVTIPGNFKYGGWEQPVADAKRQPAYLLDHDLSTDEYELRNAIFTNSLIMQGLKALVTKHLPSAVSSPICVVISSPAPPPSRARALF
jgi:hypothetical protein